MTAFNYSERVLKALAVIETKDFDRNGLRAFYQNAAKVPGITDAEREAVVAALEKRIRMNDPGFGTAMFGPKDQAARDILNAINNTLKGEFDLTGNIVGSGVKTGGDMISGDSYVSVYISYKSQDRRHATFGYFQAKVDADHLFIVTFYQTGRQVDSLPIKEEFDANDFDAAITRYREHLTTMV